MTGISRGEKWILALLAGFLLVTGGWFLLEKNTAQPWQITVGSETGTSEAEDANSWPDSLLEGEMIDLNTADVYDLGRLPGIGEKRAQAIVDYREEHGPFASVEELVLVDGIGDGILAGVSGYVTVGTAD